MSTLLIEGGHRLEGRVAVEGNKNAALPLLAACLLTEEECVLSNVPRIGDVEVMARLLLDVGAEVEGIGTTTLRIRAPKITTDTPDRSLVGRLRGSVLLLGPLLARCGRAHIAPPGGDFPARRTISTHMEALRALGAREGRSADHVLETPNGLTGTSMYLFEASVTGTETALLAAASAKGVTEIRHAATEPHVVELCEFLAGMGAGITGIGSANIRVEGVPKLHGASHRLGGDYIEAGSWAVVGAITGGEMAIEGAREDDIEVVAAVLQRMNVQCGMRDGVFEVKPSTPVAIRKITTGLWPSFPSDLVSLVTVLATQAAGRTLVHDWMYELRLFALEQLRGGRTLDSRDLRSGMSLIAAGLTADGQTRVAPLETVERGYSQLVDRLQALGAKVAKVE
jgi:UDP-N-acetylglucosamine 1-carboxyvinyltransferase